MRQYYNPRLTPDEAQALDVRNWCVLAVNQALCGAITPNCLAVAFELIDSRLVIHTFLAESIPEDCEFFGDDLGTEIEAPWGADMPSEITRIETMIHVAPVPPEVLGHYDWSDLVFAQRAWRARAS